MSMTRVSYRIFRLGGVSIYEKEGGEINPYVNKCATAHLPKGRECPTIWWAIHKFFGGTAWGGGGGENPRFPPSHLHSIIITTKLTISSTVSSAFNLLTSDLHVAIK